MNLSAQSGVRKIKIRDSRFPGEEFTHHVRAIKSSDRVIYNREMAIEAGLTADELERRDVLAFKGDPMGPPANLYDKIIDKVEGYTINADNIDPNSTQTEVDVMTRDNWREMIPVEHKSAVVNELLPRATVVKN